MGDRARGRGGRGRGTQGPSLTPAAAAKRKELQSLGVDQFAIYLMHDQMDATLEAYGRSIIPTLQPQT